MRWRQRWKLKQGIDRHGTATDHRAANERRRGAAAVVARSPSNRGGLSRRGSGGGAGAGQLGGSDLQCGLAGRRQRGRWAAPAPVCSGRTRTEESIGSSFTSLWPRAAARADCSPGPKSSLLVNNMVGSKRIRYKDSSGIQCMSKLGAVAVSRRLQLGKLRGRRFLMAGPRARASRWPIPPNGRHVNEQYGDCRELSISGTTAQDYTTASSKVDVAIAGSDVVLARDRCQGWLAEVQDGRPARADGYRYVRAPRSLLRDRGRAPVVVA